VGDSDTLDAMRGLVGDGSLYTSSEIHRPSVGRAFVGVPTRSFDRMRSPVTVPWCGVPEKRPAAASVLSGSFPGCLPDRERGAWSRRACEPNL
jgi:hypothetical protein